jgi:2-methylcitrate dehydratase PrpD
MKAHSLKPEDVERVTALVHQGAIDVLGPVTDPQTVHQSKFSMGFVLANIAVNGRAGLADFTDAALRDERLRSFHDKVDMKLDAEVDTAYPKRWIGKVEVQTKDGRKVFQRVDTPKGDPESTLTRPELEDKAVRLARYADGASEAEMRGVIQRVWSLREAADVRDFLPRA